MKNGHAEVQEINKDSKKEETKSTIKQQNEPLKSSITSNPIMAMTNPFKQNSGTANVTKVARKCETPDKSKSPPDYFAHLKSLNLSVATWITKHLDDNPYCILTPVFKDYERHLEKITKYKPASSSEDEESTG